MQVKATEDRTTCEDCTIRYLTKDKVYNVQLIERTLTPFILDDIESVLFIMDYTDCLKLEV